MAIGDSAPVTEDAAADGPIRLEPKGRLPDLDQPDALGFAIKTTTETQRSKFALVCDMWGLPRVRRINRAHNLDHPNLLKFEGASVVTLPGSGGRRFALLYQRPKGKRLALPEKGVTTRLDPTEIIDDVILPVARALGALHKTGVVHGAVRPENMYYQTSQGRGVILGDWLTAPPGRYQTAAAVPIEMTTADAPARGAGGPAVDYYALGVAAMTLYLGQDPGRGRAPQELLEAKLARGSFAALADHDKIPRSLAAYLEGLLADDPKMRWEESAVQRGQGIATLPPSGSRVVYPAQRPFSFAGANFDNRQKLAHAFAENNSDAATEIRSGSVAEWLRSVLGDRKAAEQLDDASFTNEPRELRRTAEPEVLVARAIQILDPKGPIRFRGLSLTLDGIGPALADAVSREDNATAEHIVAMLARGIHIAWMDRNAEDLTRFDKQRLYWKAVQSNALRTEPGFGIERCLYDMNPTLSCRTPILAEQYINNVSELIPALELLYAGGSNASDPVDRHFAGFVACRLKLATSSDLSDLQQNSLQPARRQCAVLNLLATLHADFGSPKVPNLAKYVADHLSDALDEFHNRAIRQDLTDRVKRAAKAGNLTLMARILNDKSLRTADSRAFRRARVQYAANKNRLDQLRDRGAIYLAAIRAMGYRLSEIMALSVLGVAVALAIVSHS